MQKRKSPTSPNMRRARARESLINSAAELFARHGFDGVSTAMVASKTGLTQPMVHYYFANKMTLWSEVVAHLIARRLELYPINYQALVDIDPLARLRFMLGARIEANMADSFLEMMVLQEALHASDKFERLVAAYIADTVQAVGLAAEDAIASGQIRGFEKTRLMNVLGSMSCISSAFVNIPRMLYGVGTDERAYLADMRENLLTVFFKGLSTNQAIGPENFSRDSRDDDPSPERDHPTVMPGEGAFETLLQCATDLFADHGYDGVTTRMIASRAGLTQSMVNYHFTSKELLWKKAVSRLVAKRRLLAPFESALASSIPPIQRLKIFTRLLIDLNAREPRFGKIFLQESLARGDRLQWLIDNYVRNVFDHIEGVGLEAEKRGEIRHLPRGQLSIFLITVGYHLYISQKIMSSVYGTSVFQPGHVAEFSSDFIDIVFNGLETKK